MPTARTTIKATPPAAPISSFRRWVALCFSGETVSEPSEAGSLPCSVGSRVCSVRGDLLTQNLAAQLSLSRHEHRCVLILDQEHHELRRLGRAGVPSNDVN